MTALLSRPPLRWFPCTWPRKTDSKQITAGLLTLHGLGTPRQADTVIVEVEGHAGQVVHRLAVGEPRSSSVRRQLEAAIGGLALEALDIAPTLTISRSWRAWLSTRTRPLATGDPEAISRAVLTALGSAGQDERLVMQLLLGPVLRPIAVGSSVRTDVATSLGHLLQAPLAGPGELDAVARQALRDKQGVPGWRACLRLGVLAEGTRRQRQLLGRLAAALRMAQGPGVQIGFTECSARRFVSRRRPMRWPLVLNTKELTGIIGWPIGETRELPVVSVRSSRVAASPLVPSHGRIVGMSTATQNERPLALNPADALQHLWVLGPTGVGKSTLMLNLICQDMEAGRSLVVIEPKGDLVQDVLERVPDHRLDEVVVLDPTDAAPVGLNPLTQAGVAREVVVDQVLHIFKRLFADSWGPRTQDILASGLLTLTYQPHMSLPALPLLFTDANFRRRVLARVNDPLALNPFWQWFEALSAAERGAVLAPVMNKLRVFLLRERVRRVIGQARPRFDLGSVFTGSKIVLVNLAKGALGPEAASLLGSLAVSGLWQAALRRSAVPVAKRHPVLIYIDEFQDFLALPTNLGEGLAQARGLGAGFTLANQHVTQLPLDMRAAVLANARSRVVFRLSHDDAAVLAKGSTVITAEDIEGLGKYEAYVSLLAEGEATPYASVRALPVPPAIRPASEVLARSRARWGIPVAEIDAALAALGGHLPPVKPAGSTGEFGRRRRTGNGGSQPEDPR